MAKRKALVRVVLDTSVIIRAWTTPNPLAASVRVYRFWLWQRFQLVVSAELVNEYATTIERLNFSPERAERFMRRLDERITVSWVNLGRRVNLERDVRDVHVLSTADSGNAKYLVTLDRDMLEIPLKERRRFKFEIVTPAQFLGRIA